VDLIPSGLSAFDADIVPWALHSVRIETVRRKFSAEQLSYPSTVIRVSVIVLCAYHSLLKIVNITRLI